MVITEQRFKLVKVIPVITGKARFSIIIIIFLGRVLLSCQQRSALPPPPNIVIILADDLGYGDPKCYNPHSKINTPNIDQLAGAGVRFTDAHSNSAVCTPTRYGLLTGRYAWRSKLKRGVTWSYDSAIIEPGRTTVASLLRAKGYATACIGKWHLGLDWQWNGDAVDFTRPFGGGPNELGFDYFYGITASLDIPPYCYLENNQVDGAITHYSRGDSKSYEGEYWRLGPTMEGFDHYQTLSVFTKKVTDFIENHEKKRSDEPFLVYFPMTAPHLPWIPTEKFKGTSQAGDYGDMVAMVDWSVGEVIKALRSSGIEENTLVIFTSDNGAHWITEKEEAFDHRANGNWLGMKGDIWEGGHRVPFIASWPGKIQAGSTMDVTISTTDILATCATISGYPLHAREAEDSRNLLPLLLGEAEEPEVKETIQHSAHGVFAIRQGEWKYIEAQGSGGFLPADKDTILNRADGQLYHLIRDPAEENNLIDQEREKVMELKRRLREIKGEPV